jgi:hypothetical protein
MEKQSWRKGTNDNISEIYEFETCPLGHYLVMSNDHIFFNFSQLTFSKDD